MCVGPLKGKKKTGSASALDIAKGIQGRGQLVPAPLGSPAATAVMADRIEGNPEPRTPTGLAGVIARYAQQLGIPMPKQSPTDPNAVAAGRVGRSIGAADLRIGG